MAYGLAVNVPQIEGESNKGTTAINQEIFPLIHAH